MELATRRKGSSQGCVTAPGTEHHTLLVMIEVGCNFHCSGIVFTDFDKLLRVPDNDCDGVSVSLPSPQAASTVTA